MQAAGDISFFLIFFRAGDEGDDGERRSPVQREGLVDFSPQRVGALRQLQGPPERVLDQQPNLAEPEQRPRRQAHDDGQDDGRHRRREAER